MKYIKFLLGIMLLMVSFASYAQIPVRLTEEPESTEEDDRHGHRSRPIMEFCVIYMEQHSVDTSIDGITKFYIYTMSEDTETIIISADTAEELTESMDMLLRGIYRLRIVTEEKSYSGEFEY